jgi:hypothetical protein
MRTPATNPPSRVLCLEFREQFFKPTIRVFSEAFISVYDVLQAAHTCLRQLPKPGIVSAHDYIDVQPR